jgi:hypothetical protein
MLWEQERRKPDQGDGPAGTAEATNAVRAGSRSGEDATAGGSDICETAQARLTGLHHQLVQIGISPEQVATGKID